MRKFTKSLLALALLIMGVQGAKAQEPFYSIDYSDYTSFPFYVMGFTPDWVDGIMTDQGAEGWHQYFIADGMITEENGSYLVKAMVKASSTETFNINMGWGWGNGQQVGAQVTIPESTEFQEVTWQYDGVGAPAAGSHTNLVAQPWAGGVTIEWKSLQVFKVDPPKDPVWSDLLINGDLEGEGTSCFYVTEQGVGGPFLAKIYDGVGVNGSKGLMVQSGEREYLGKDGEGKDQYAGQDWDTQFFIRFPYILPEGTKFKVTFDYKADKAATANTQAHANPGTYHHWSCIGDVNFTTEWQTFEKTVTVDASMSKGDNGNGNGTGLQTIAFNLAVEKTATQYFFDNLKIEVDEEVLPTLSLNPDENATKHPLLINDEVYAKLSAEIADIAATYNTVYSEFFALAQTNGSGWAASFGGKLSGIQSGISAMKGTLGGLYGQGALTEESTLASIYEQYDAVVGDLNGLKAQFEQTITGTVNQILYQLSMITSSQMGSLIGNLQNELNEKGVAEQYADRVNALLQKKADAVKIFEDAQVAIATSTDYVERLTIAKNAQTEINTILQEIQEEIKAITDITTGINSIYAESFAKGQVYDMNGRHVTAPTKGMFIINGKKVVIK